MPRGREQYCDGGRGAAPTTAGEGRDADLRRLFETTSSSTSVRPAGPAEARPGGRGAPACAGHHDLVAAAAVEGAGRAAGRSRRAGRAGAHGGEARPVARGRGDAVQHLAVKEADAHRLGATSVVLTRTRTKLRPLAGKLRFHPGHDLARRTTSRATSACCGPAHGDGGRASGEAAAVAAFSLIMGNKRSGRLGDRRHRGDPGDARLLRQARHRRGRRADPHPEDQPGLRAGWCATT